MEYLDRNLTIYNCTFNLYKSNSKFIWRLRSKKFQLWTNIEIELKIFNFDNNNINQLGKIYKLNELIKYLDNNEFLYYIGERTLSFYDYCYYWYGQHRHLDKICLLFFSKKAKAVFF